MKKIDMHVHTTYSSDGKEKIEDIIKQAKRVGLDGIAITDHNSTEGWKETVEFGKKYGIIVIKGEEVSSSKGHIKGHILAYGIREKIEKGLSPEETVKEIRKQGGVAVAAHPYRISNGLGDVARKVDFDAIEVLNSRSPRFINRKAERLAEEMGKPMTGGSDAHEINEIGAAYTVFPDWVEDENDAIKAIEQGKVSPGGSSQGWRALLSYNTEKLFRWISRGGGHI